VFPSVVCAILVLLSHWPEDHPKVASVLYFAVHLYHMGSHGNSNKQNNGSGMENDTFFVLFFKSKQKKMSQDWSSLGY
jgi:hypothetical protein